MELLTTTPTSPFDLPFTRPYSTSAPLQAYATYTAYWSGQGTVRKTSTECQAHHSTSSLTLTSTRRQTRPAMFNTPAIRNGGFGALQVEAVTNRPLSIARRHYAASQLRMRDIEPDELDSSEWVRFLVMEDRERERWMHQFLRRRSSSDGSTSSREDRETQSAKAEEARLEAEEANRNEAVAAGSSSYSAGQTPAVSLWVRQFDGMSLGDQAPTAARPLHRRIVADVDVDAPPAYNTVTRSRTPPPAYEPRGMMM